MLEHRYDLVIQHHASVEPVDHLVRDLLVLLDKEGDPYIEYKLSEGLLFPDSKTTVLENITQDEAEYYQKRFRELMVETSIRPTLQQTVEKLNLVANDTSKDLHTCPACQHQQPRSKSGMNTCQNCNLVAEKYQRHPRREENPAQESGVYKFQQDKLMREALARARADEEEQLRREARLQLSLESKKRPLDIAIGVTAIALMLLAGILIITSIQRKETQILATQPSVGLRNLEGAAGPNTNPLPAELATPSNLAAKPIRAALSAPEPNSTKTNQIITQGQIDQLKTLLEKDRPNPYLNKLSPEQFKADHQKLERLLELNKPELAVAFINQLTDQYAAALMLLKVADSEIKQNHHSNDADILRTFNHLLSRAPALQQPLVSASFSLLLHLQGQDQQAQAMLATTLADLRATNNSLLFIVDKEHGDSAQTQKLGIVLQIIKDYHRFAQTDVAHDFIKVAEEILAASPNEALIQAKGMTLLAAACLVLGEQAQALAWLHKIPDPNTREQLLAKLHRL